jgi:hypothetical protein
MVTWWLEHSLPYSPAEMDEMFNALAMPGIRGLMSTTES